MRQEEKKKVCMCASWLSCHIWRPTSLLGNDPPEEKERGDLELPHSLTEMDQGATSERGRNKGRMIGGWIVQLLRKTDRSEMGKTAGGERGWHVEIEWQRDRQCGGERETDNASDWNMLLADLAHLRRVFGVFSTECSLSICSFSWAAFKGKERA